MAGSAVRIAILANASQAKRELNSTASAAQGMGAKLSKYAATAGKAVGVGLAVAGAAAVKFGVSAVKSGSDAQQSLGATETVFGKYADSVIRNSEKAATAIGLSANEYRELSNVSGALLAGAGTPLKEVASLTDDLNRRAADMAATFGGPTREAVEAISSLLKGEADPIERYGVSIKQSDVSARLAAKGLDKLTGSAKKQAEQQERLDLLFEKTAKTQGAFKRESNTLANQQQVLAAKFENVKAKVGTALLPVLTKLTTWVSDRVVPVLEKWADWLTENSDEIGRLGKTISGKAIPVIQDLADVVKQVAGFFAGLPDPVKQTSVQIAAAALVLPKLTTALTAAQTQTTGLIAKTKLLQAEMALAPSKTAAASTALGKFSGVAKQAAGVGGLIALTSGLTQAKNEGSTFSSVMKGAAGGAGIGAMFGPIGALVGAAGGAGLTALAGSFHETADEASAARLELLKTQGFKNAKEDADTLAASLVGVANAYGRIPRAAVRSSFVNADGKLDSDVQLLRDAGVSMDTIVSATMGQRDAQKLVNEALQGSIAPLQSQADSAKAAYDAVKDGLRDVVTQSGQVIKNGESLSSDEVKIYEDAWREAAEALKAAETNQRTFNARVDGNTSVIRANREAVKQLAGDLGLTVKQYKSFPAKARTQIEADGLPQTMRDSLKLIGQYKGLQSFRNIKALIEATDAKLTTDQVKELTRRYDLTPKQVKTLIEATGIERETAKVINLRKQAEDTAGTYTVNVVTKYTSTGDTPRGLGAGTGGGGKNGRLNYNAGRQAAQDFGDGWTSMLGKSTSKGIDKATGSAVVSADKLAQKILDRLNAKLSDAESVRDSILSMIDSISSSLTGDLFGALGDESGTALDKFRQGLAAAGTTAANVAAAVQKLLGAGVSNDFIQDLVASGNTELIVQLAAAPDAAALAAQYEGVIGQNEDTARAVAEEIIGVRLDTLNQQIADLVKQIDKRDRKPVSVKLTSEQVSRLQRGKEIRMDLDFWDSNGGRASA